MTMLADHVDFVIGVDTQKNTNTAAVVVAATGAALGDCTVPSMPRGHQVLLEMAETHLGRRAWAIEGTGSYGAGLARFLSEHGEQIVELHRPARAPRRGGKKSDPIDAVRAAREALTRHELGEARAVGQRVALAVLLAARRSAIDARTDAQRQLQGLVVAAPESLRARMRGLPGPQMASRAARLRLSADADIETAATTEVLRALARRVLELTSEERAHERQITAIVRAWRPDLLEQRGVGPIVAATVLCAWSHAGRFRSEGAFASLGGISPIPASSGLTTRHRLNRSGDRQLNRAIHVVVINRLRSDPRSLAYAERRRAEGKSDREIRRCLKRYVARQLFRQLEGAALTT